MSSHDHTRLKQKVHPREPDERPMCVCPYHPAPDCGAGQSRPRVSVEHGADKAMSAENPKGSEEVNKKGDDGSPAKERPYLHMLLQILRALKSLPAKFALVRFERNVYTDMRGDVVALDGCGSASAPCACKAKVVG